MAARRSVYILLTSQRVRAYFTHGHALKVYQRAKRMGVKDVEFMSCEAKAGDPYKRAKVQPYCLSGDAVCTCGGTKS